MARKDPPRDDAGKFDRSPEERRRQVNIRYTDSEYQELSEAASACGMTVSDYVRSRSLGHRVISKTDREMLMLLNKLGGLQKHWFLELQIEPTKTAHILDLMAEAVREISGQIRRRGTEDAET